MSLLSTLPGSFMSSPAAIAAAPVAETEEVAPNPLVDADGPITAQQIELVQSTWGHVAPIADQAATLFYGKLFELDPEIKPLFAQTDLPEQKRKLMQTIGVAVKNLHRLEDIVPVVRNLGKRHIGYGVQDRHYDTVAAALLWTLEQGLGDLFTSEVNDAWTATYAVLAGTMKDAAAEAVGG